MLAFLRHTAGATSHSSLPRVISSALYANGFGTASSGQQWEWMKSVGHKINPCNSKLHPAVTDAGLEPGTPELPVQQAYTPGSTCFGCGPAAEGGLGLRSHRIPGGLEASIVLDDKYQAFPGIMNGGIISTLFDCHGNWTAAIALMDKSFLPRPPLTLTFELLVNYKEATPPNQSLVVRSQVVKIKDSANVGGGKATVQVDMSLHLAQPGGRETLLATATGIFKKLGALRAL